MKIKVGDKLNNELLRRVEVSFEVDHEGAATPSRLSVRDKLAAKLSREPELVVIPRFKTRFGKGVSKGVAHVYKTEEDLKDVEPRYILKRFAAKEEPAEGKKEEESKKERKEEQKPPSSEGISEEGEGKKKSKKKGDEE